MIKKFLYVLTAFILFQNSFAVNVSQAQTDTRTNTTKIADLLAQLPSTNNNQFEKNMKEITNMGEDGYVELIKRLNTAGNNSNLLEYAIAGYSAYSTKKGQESSRNMAVSAYCKVLPQLNNVSHVIFIISQFEVMGTEKAVGCISSYLTTEPLADVTARVLAKIGTPNALSALELGVKSNNDRVTKASIEALGSVKTYNSTALILPFAYHKNADVVKASLFALSNLADPSSETVLMKAAEAAMFGYEPTNSSTSLFNYITNISIKDKAKAATLARYVLSKTTSENQLHSRTAALEILSKSSTDSKIFFDALKDKNPTYKMSAVHFATPHLSESNAKDWIKALKGQDPLTQAAILDMFAAKTHTPALDEIMKYVPSSNLDVQKAAVNAVVKMGGSAKLPELIALMNKGKAQDIESIADGIRRMEKGGVPETIAAYLGNSKPEVKVALINILADKAANEQIESIYSELKSNSPEVKSAAFNALKSVSFASNQAELFDLLKNSSDAMELDQIQQAIIASNRGSKNIDAQSDALLTQMASASADKKPLFYKILASLGGQKALTAVVNAYNEGDASTKKTTLDALSNWASADAAVELIKIARNTTDGALLQQALTGYLQLTRKNSYTPEQRLLLLRNVMELAQTDAIKVQVLRDVVQAKSYHSILFAGTYLDNPALQQAAANAVMNITMAGKYNGEIVKSLLNKTIAVITGPDAGYQKEGMRTYISEMEAGEGFVQVFNGKDLTGWQGLVQDPIKRSKMSPADLATAQAKADIAAKESWKVINGELHFMIKGDNLATIKKYGDMEMLVDWKIIDDKKGEGDAGIYLRGTPQVQIWDLARTNVGAQVGSGGLYNNQKNPSKPLVVADNALDEWNTFRILMIGDRVTVYLNGQLVTDNVILENYWNRNMAIFAEEQIELQAHGSPVAYRDIYIREIPRPTPFELSEQEKKEGFKVLFDGTNMHEWTGNTTDYIIENGNMAIRPKPGKGSGGNLFTKEQYSDFNFRFEFQLTPGANNGLGIRSPLEGDPAYVGMELQILDNDAPIYKDLKEYQYHGSIYGVVAAKRGALKPVGEWNYQEVIAQGSKIKIILNGVVIVDADIEPFKTKGTIDNQKHPGLLRESGHIGFLGHGSPLQFRNIRVKDLGKPSTSTTTTKK